MAAGQLNHQFDEKLLTATTTHQGSKPKLAPLVASALRYPISHRRYTAVQTSPAATAFIARGVDLTAR